MQPQPVTSPEKCRVSAGNNSKEGKGKTMKHIHARVTNKNNGLIYEADIFQCAYDEICISLSNILYFEPSFIQFDIPVKKKEGFRFKANTASISNDTGKAADLIDFLSTWPGNEYINCIIQKVIFDHPKKRLTPGL